MFWLKSIRRSLFLLWPFSLAFHFSDSLVPCARAKLSSFSYPVQNNNLSLVNNCMITLFLLHILFSFHCCKVWVQDCWLDCLLSTSPQWGVAVTWMISLAIVLIIKELLILKLSFLQVLMWLLHFLEWFSLGDFSTVFALEVSISQSIKQSINRSIMTSLTWSLCEY